ncbi:MAG: hypothetical protein E7240_05705 [Lachnospiraceae bacterium]|nr:hypothetical protein [Lachnospiraceae bacterium]
MHKESNIQMISKLLFRLLPIQILLSMVNCVNAIVSSLFASNMVGAEAMGAVGLYGPFNLFIGSVSLVLVGGSQLLASKYIGKNENEKTQGVFSLNLLLSLLVAGVMILLHILIPAAGLTKIFTPDPSVQHIFGQYMLGQAVGLIPLVAGGQLSAFLSLENQTKRVTAAGLSFIAANVILNYLFVAVLKMEAFGLALASSLGMWVFLIVLAQYYFTGRSLLKLNLRLMNGKETGNILRIGYPGALSQMYQTIRGFIVNGLLTAFIGAAGISAFAAANTLMGFAWTIPAGMLNVSRMMIGVSVGEEDRQTLTDIMRNMFLRFLPLMASVCALIILCAKPLAGLYYKDTASSVYQMTVWGFRILPLCMPFSIICMHFVCYAQVSDKQVLVQILSFLDGVACVAGFSALLVPVIGIKGVYIANVLNGVVTTITIIVYAWVRKKKFPTNMEELMVIPEDFGVPEEERMDLSIRSMEEVVSISRQIQDFCLSKGIDPRRSMLAGLSMEEMAGNIVDHGFTKDRKKHSVDVRVVHKENDVILRIKDDCVPFDPMERQKMTDASDPAKNIGIRMIFRMAEKITHQNILGLNVLTIRV